MIKSGVNGLSRGDTSEEIVQETPLISFILVYLPADNRSKNLIPWIRSWWLKGEKLHHLTPNEWHSKTLVKRFLRIQPVATEAVSGNLCRNNHFFKSNLYIICLPTLLIFRWRNKLRKVADTIVSVMFNDAI